MKKYLATLFLLTSFIAHAEEVKLKCLMRISYSSTFDASETLQENVMLSINKNSIIVENSGTRLSSLYRFSSPPKLTANDFSDENKWDVSNQNNSVPVASVMSSITIDRNTGNISYEATTQILKSEKNIGSSKVNGHGSCQKVDTTKHKF